ncbi:MAG TPA: alpha/beta fold hydrolase, partial [Planctomycetes bacterium]|nr:alpha/beta fold hydrolase [Planctomycetota bacterium]
MTPRAGALLEYRTTPFSHWRITPPTGRGHSEMILVHGLGEHAGRMMPLARKLSELGYRCRVPDLPGHGGHGEDSHHGVIEAYLQGDEAADVVDRIQGMPEALQQEAQKIAAKMHQRLFGTSFEQIIDRVEKLALWSAIDGNESGVPHYIWGHSLGGLASFHAASRIDLDPAGAPAGLVLGSPAFAPPAAEQDLMARFFTSQAYFFSSMTLLRPIAALQRLLLRGLGIDGDGEFANEAVSDLPAERLLHSIDPLQNHQIPLCFAGRLLPWMAKARRSARTLRTPVFVFAPGYDPIVDPSGVRAVTACLQKSFDPRRPHLLDIHEQMRVHDLARSSCGDSIVTRV